MDTNTTPALDLDSILVIAGGTLLCAGARVLSQAPKVRSGLEQLARHPEVRKIGSSALHGLVREIGGALTRWGGVGMAARVPAVG